MTAHPMSFYESSHLDGGHRDRVIGLSIEGIFKDFHQTEMSDLDARTVQCAIRFAILC